MARLVRRKLNPLSVCLVLTALCVPVVFIFTWFGIGVLFILCFELTGLYRYVPYLSGTAVGIVAIGVIAFLLCRLVFLQFRYEWVEDDGRLCWRCGYDLWSNISGRCPECGERLERRCPTIVDETWIEAPSRRYS